ncbi:MAG: carboxypeptidase regulatory-like domain-containing protein [Longimicrobiales bacterium]|nr:carboxypeptidase regulatory-like domain-containing protein [Longimicrobiales bacterium]
MLRCHAWIIAVVATVAVAHAAPLPAQVLRGRVLDDATDAPVAGVLIMLAQGNVPRAHAVSDDRGMFVLEPGAPGTYSLRAVRLGYSESVVPALELASPGTFLEFDLLLSPKPVALEGVVVSALRYQSDIDFLGLRVEDLGDRILTRDFLAEMGFRDVGAALERRALPGVVVTRGENVSYMENATILSQRLPFCVRLARSRRFDGTQQCALVVLDQSFVSQEAVDALKPDDLEAVVVLTPIEAVQLFGLMGSPGAVLLYTRRGR